MSRLFTCGFEEQNLAETMWTEGATPVSVTSATVTPHSGLYSCQFNAATEYVMRGLASAVATGIYYTRAYLLMPAWPPADIEIVAVGTQTGTWTVAWAILAKADGTLTLFNYATSTFRVSTTVLAVNTWYRLEWRHVLSTTPTGELELKIFLGDATTPLESLTPIINEITVATSYGRTRFGRTSGTLGTFTLYFDDIAWNVDDGTAPTSWCGPGKIALMVPDSDLANTWEDELGATGTYTKITKLPTATVADTTFTVEAAALNSIDRFGLNGPPGEIPSTATIVLVAAYARVGGSQTSLANMRLKLWNETGLPGLTDGPNINCNTTTWKSFLGFNEALVVSGAGKSKADLTAWTVGYENLGPEAASRQRKVSALWVNVEWLEGGAEPPPTGTAGSSAGTRSIGVYSPRATTQPIARGWA